MGAEPRATITIDQSADLHLRTKAAIAMLDAALSSPPENIPRLLRGLRKELGEPPGPWNAARERRWFQYCLGRVPDLTLADVDWEPTPAAEVSARPMRAPAPEAEAEVTSGRLDLPPRQNELAHLLADGHSSETAAGLMGISLGTCRTHRSLMTNRLRKRGYGLLAHLRAHGYGTRLPRPERPLTAMQERILLALAGGRTTEEAGRALHMSHHAITSHTAEIGRVWNIKAKDGGLARVVATFLSMREEQREAAA